MQAGVAGRSATDGAFSTTVRTETRLTSHPHPDPWTARVAVLNAFLKAGEGNRADVSSSASTAAVAQEAAD